ncbi:hypothetical protein ACFTZB_37570, partial [Rhodococcus sp. NPDC057014]|uniref:hypothetical protein n=1 Tax=Rhodococcus sp. NPDC057014 TaxID=3346000 RepID=UPI0036449AED
MPTARRRTGNGDTGGVEAQTHPFSVAAPVLGLEKGCVCAEGVRQWVERSVVGYSQAMPSLS